MKSQDAVANLRLMADTIEELEIDNIISCETYDHKMRVHLHDITITPLNCITWVERFCPTYPFEKTFEHNNILFYALTTQEKYDKEK